MPGPAASATNVGEVGPTRETSSARHWGDYRAYSRSLVTRAVANLCLITSDLDLRVRKIVALIIVLVNEKIDTIEEKMMRLWEAEIVEGIKVGPVTVVVMLLFYLLLEFLFSQ